MVLQLYHQRLKQAYKRTPRTRKEFVSLNSVAHAIAAAPFVSEAAPIDAQNGVESERARVGPPHYQSEADRLTVCRLLPISRLYLHW
ncbi:MAG TPA: hypothetical protein VK217_08175, partial [Acidimicrobiales bacterium]|nr:hypothetical protein [Acidimicrobiales bacterium]